MDQQEQTTEIITTENETFSLEKILTKAIEEKVPIETMEKFLAMRRELKAEWAKKQFDRAMSQFQSDCPVIEKEKDVDFTSKRTGSRTKYSYAPLDQIVRQIKDIISKNGLSYTIETENTETKIVSIVTVKHIDGHSESTRFEVPIDKESFMSAQQQYGAASTFGKRYAFCNAFGILTGDEDNDANTDTQVDYTPAPAKTYKVNGAPTPPYEQKGPRPASVPQKILIKKLVIDKQAPADKVELIGKNIEEYDMGTAKEIIDYLLKLPARQHGTGTESVAKQQMRKGMKQSTGFGAPADELPTIQVDERDTGVHNPETGKNYPLIDNGDEEINVDEIPF